MSSITEHEQKIKRELLASLGDLTSFLAQCIEDNRSAHEVEKGLWEQVKQLGRQSLNIFFNHCGEGDEGEVVILSDGRQVKRLPELHARWYSTVFGEFKLSRYVYASRQGILHTAPK